MTIPPDIALEILNNHHTHGISNLFAQSNASHVLYEVGEDKANFPQFDAALVDKVTISAYSILAAGVSLFEETTSVNATSADAIFALEEAAILLHNVHSPHALESESSKFHMLVASMAFYAAGQYSRSFVTLKRIESQFILPKIIASFIRKQFDELIHQTNPYTLADLSSYTDSDGICEHAVTTAISRSLALTIEFLASGEFKNIENAMSALDIGQQIAKDYESPSLWWITRLLKLMIGGMRDASLWKILPPYFPDDPILLNHYTRLMAFGKPPITELWTSQKEAIPFALNPENRGAIINLRTSSGKTRVAELAILQALMTDPTAKVLYLAPFRSLALEIEQSLGKVFNWCGHKVSHLYGGFRLSTADRQLAEESKITIATPEKARAILRSSPELLNEVKLIVVDEGHLIGADVRLIRNELFIDQLRYIANSIGCRILLLSAVLPNPEDLSGWLTGEPTNIGKSNWKPSAERFGILRWRGNHVRIDWRGDFESYNPKFVKSKPLGFGKRRNPFPNNKNEAVAATAVRLANVGPVMIFSARANSVPGLAKAVLLALGEKPTRHPWPDSSWNMFSATCEEELPTDSIEFKAAQYGVICHSNRLPPQVRLATEHLMRSNAPKIIIATTTLAQGVNIGISSVIVSTPYISREPINHRDFWNICGRAGRAFVDGEGKVLYAIDDTRSRWHVNKDKGLAKIYFESASSDPVDSGLLYALHSIKDVAQRTGIDFEQLMTMVAENDFSALGENERWAEYVLDLIDDGLLALNEDEVVNPEGASPEEWVDDVFRGSLAAIQAGGDRFNLTSEEFIKLITARTVGVVGKLPNPVERKAYVATGLPLTAARCIYRDSDLFVAESQKLIDNDLSTPSIIEFLQWIEEWARANASSIVDALPDNTLMDLIRTHWIEGDPMRTIIAKTDKATSVCKDIYGFQFPWLIHAVSQQLIKMDYEELSEAMSSVALCVELGLPNELAAWVFMSGVRSRSASTEISKCSVSLGTSLSVVRRNLRDPEILRDMISRVSSTAKVWLDLQLSEFESEKAELPTFPIFKAEKLDGIDTIVARSNAGSTYLCSVDGLQRMAVKVSEKWPFYQVADDHRFAFVRSADGLFKFSVRDPRFSDECY